LKGRKAGGGKKERKTCLSFPRPSAILEKKKGGVCQRGVWREKKKKKREKKETVFDPLQTGGGRRTDKKKDWGGGKGSGMQAPWLVRERRVGG